MEETPKHLVNFLHTIFGLQKLQHLLLQKGSDFLYTGHIQEQCHYMDLMIKITIISKYKKYYFLCWFFASSSKALDQNQFRLLNWQQTQLQGHQCSHSDKITKINRIRKSLCRRACCSFLYTQFLQAIESCCFFLSSGNITQGKKSSYLLNQYKSISYYGFHY